MENYSAIKNNETESILVIWMNLESVIQSKSEKKYCGYYISIYKCVYMESSKIVLRNLFDEQE